MKFSLASMAVVALATQTATADWFGSGNAAYNKWHETELERWLSDHDISYPTASDRKDLQNLVEKNWNDNVAKPYSKWNTNQLSSYLTSKGQQAKKGTEQNKDSLIEQVQSYWHSTADQANEAAGDVKSYIFDTWTESQLKSFLDFHGVPNPSPRTRDSLLHTARSNYQSVANKAGETASYPGDWIYSQWSDSELKAWLDERGVPVPQPGNRDKLIASIRRNAYVASNDASSKFASASSSAKAATQSLSDQLLNSWSDSQVKEWLDKNGVPVPQGSKRNELVALARKNSAKLSGGNVAGSASSVSGSAASAYGAATTSAGNYYAQATDDAYGGFRYYYDYALNQIGMGSKEAKASLSSVSSSVSSAAAVASSSASSAASVASSSASSLSSAASSSASSASSSAAKAGKNPASAASSAASVASASASSAASSISSSAASVAKSSSSSAASVAKSSSSSVSSVAKSSSSSASSVASKSSSSAKQEL